MSLTSHAMEQALREPWHSLHRQRLGVRLGMWVFLASEVMFFGGAFMLYTMYRMKYPVAFGQASGESSIWYGSVNTAVLLTSSLTIVVASEAARIGLRRLTLWCMPITASLGFLFLVIKGFEYREDLSKHLMPGADFKLHEPATQLFWAFYWLMTSVHAVHLTLGIAMVTLLAFQVWRGSRSIASPALQGASLYWNLVDIVWIFLYAFIYLPGRSS